MTPRKRFQCVICGTILPAWYPVPSAPNTAMMLHHLAPDHAVTTRGSSWNLPETSFEVAG